MKSKGIVMVDIQKRGFIQRMRSYFTAKWKLQMKIDWLEYELKKCQGLLVDADNRLEAYKDVLAHISRHHQLGGLLSQSEIDIISQKRDKS